jgi:Fe-Mn family superoxide dismutase
MHHPIEPIHCRPWLLNGLSLKLLESHYENNYGGAVRKLNAIGAQLSTLDFAKAPPALVNGLKREELSALNSTLLHELYFASLGGEGKPSEAMASALARDFGSADRWRAEFVAMAHALGGGSGWVVLAYVPRDRRLVNQYASEHTQALAGAIPVLALDMYEHAYHIDFGANAKAYVDAFMRNVDWRGVEERHGDACKVEPPRPLEQKEYDVPGVGVEEVRSLLESGQPLRVIDVRPRHYLSRQQDIADGIPWRDPDRIQEWIGELSKSEPVVVYCAYGFHVGCKTAIALREAGFDARFMKGGHSAWKAIGGATKAYSETAPGP